MSEENLLRKGLYAEGLGTAMSSANYLQKVLLEGVV
jgi:hypothetical protein